MKKSEVMNKKETAVQNEQQSKTVIIDEIIRIIANKNFTIEEANKVLYETSKKINQQNVRVS